MTPPRRAFLAPEPFSPRVKVLEVVDGQTIAGILLDAVRREHLALEDLPRVAVYVDGVSLEEKLGREAMLDYVPPAGAILNIAVEVLGGGGGGGGDKNPLQTVLQIAIIVASFWVGGPAGPLAAASTFVRTAAAVAVNVAGSMALAAAFGPGDGPAEASDRRALEGASNVFRPREPFPLQLGEERVGADMAAQPYTQNVGDDVFLHVALAWHYGKTRLEDVKIGETLLADYPAGDVQVEHFLTPGPRQSYLYPGRVIQENFADELDFTGGGVWEVHTVAAGSERAEVDITLPNGLKYNADSGKVRNEEVAGQIQFAEVGTEAWAAAPFPGYTTARDKNNVLLPAGSFYLNLRTNDAVRRTYGFELPDKTKQYKVRVRAYDRDGDYPNVEGRVYKTLWTALRGIERRAPIVDENLAVTFMRIRSSDDLNGALPTVTARVTPIVPVWNGVDWSEEAPTSNEAALARWLVTGPAAAKPLREDQVDASAAIAFELIEANGWGAGVSVRDEASQQDVLIRLGRAGRFATYWNGRALCFVTDWQKPAPRQVFTGRNAEGYRYRRTFPDPIHAVIVEFRDTDSSSIAGETVVYADGYTAANAELFETLRLDFACSIERAFKEGRAYLAKRSLQVESHEWTAGVDSIATTFGDRVLVRHWSNLYGEAEARVDYRHWQGALVAGVRLDEPVTMVEGVAYALDVRRADGVIRNLALTTVPGTSRTVMFAAPRAADISPAKGDLVVFGKVDLVTEDVEIVDVEPSGDMTATIRAVRYIGEELVLAETGPIPALTSGVTPRPIAPQPRVLGAVGSPAGVTVAFDVDPVRGAMIDSIAVRWRRSAEAGQPENQWNTLPPIAGTDRQARTPPILDAVAAAGDVAGEYKVDLELRTILRNGSISDPAYALDVLVVREVNTPTGVVAAGYTRTNPDGSAYPVLYVQADAIDAGDIQDLVVEIANDRPAWRSAGQALPSRNPRGDFRAVMGGDAVFVRARWRTSDGWFSAWVETPTPVAIPAGTIATDTTHVGGVDSSLIVTTVGEVPALAAGLAAAELLIDQAVGDIDDLFAALETPTTGVYARVAAAELAITTNNSASILRLQGLEARASGAGPYLNKNAGFDDYPSTSLIPAGWDAWVGAAGTGPQPDERGGWSVQIDGLPGQSGNGLFQFLPTGSIAPDAWYVVEADFTLVSGSLMGAGLYVAWYDPTGVTFLGGETPRLWADPPAAGVDPIGGGVVGTRYTFATLVKTPVDPNVPRCQFYLMNHWSGFAGANLDIGNRIRWHTAGIRPATAAEREQQIARGGYASLAARSSAVDAALVDLELGKAEVSRVELLEARAGGANLLTKVQFTDASLGGWDHGNGGITGLGFAAPWTGDNDRAPLGEFALLSYEDGTGNDSYAEFGSPVVTVRQGDRVGFSAYVAADNTTVSLFLYWLNTSGAIIGNSGADQVGDYTALPGQGSSGGSRDLADYKRAYGFATVPAGVAGAKLMIRRYGRASMSQAFSRAWALRPMFHVATPTQTIPSPWSPAAVEARVAEARQAVATLEGRVEASSTLLVTAGNRVSGVRFLAVDGADASYSSVDFLADVFRVWSPEQLLGVAPFEIRGGTVRMRDAIVDRLAVGASIVIGSRRLAVAVQPFPVQVTDGVPITYGYGIGAAPDLVFLRDGAIQQPGSGESFNFYAESSTGTGFTPRLKITTASAPTNQTAGPGGTASGPAEKHFALAAAAAGNTVSVRVTGVIQSEYVNPNYSPGMSIADDGLAYSDGYLTIAVLGYAGGAWSQIGTLDVSPAFRTSWSDPPGLYNDAFDTGLNAFPVTPSTTHVGVAVLYESHAGSYIADLRLAYQTAGSSGTRSATPNGELTTVMVYPKNSL